MFAHDALHQAIGAVHDPDLAIATITVIDAGTNHTYRITLEDGTRRLLKVGTRFPETFEAEPKTMKTLREQTDIPIPRVYGTGRAALDYPFALYEFVPGTDVARVGELPPDVAEQLCREAGENLRTLHETTFPAFGSISVDDDSLAVDEPIDYRDMLRGSLDRQLSELRETPFAERCEALDDLGRELIDRVDPDVIQPALVHGDYRLENLSVDPTADRVTSAVLDWERPTAIDPLWDAVMAKTLLTAGYGIDPDSRRSLSTTFWNAYGDTGTGTPRRACYELLARIRLARHLDEEMRSAPEAAVRARVRDHERAFDRLLA